MDKRSRNANILVEVIVVLAGVLAYLFCTAAVHQMPFNAFLAEAWRCFYYPQYNLCYLGPLAGVNVHIHAAFVIVSASIALIVLRRFLPAAERMAPSIMASLVVLVLLGAVQSIQFMRLFALNHELFAGKTLEQKHAFMFGDLYEFPLFCKEQLPGSHQAELVTGMDQLSTAGLHDQFVLMYYLYPIRIPYNPRQTFETGVLPQAPAPSDSVILFRKNDAAQHIPDGFTIAGVWDDRNAVAVKKGL
jgi:hypothetical protein